MQGADGWKSTDLVDAGFWSPDLANCKINDADIGGTRMAMTRSDAGVGEVKVGGASFMGVRFQDSNGYQLAGSYVGWADEASEADGATSVTTFGALIAAAVALMF